MRVQFFLMPICNTKEEPLQGREMLHFLCSCDCLCNGRSQGRRAVAVSVSLSILKKKLFFFQQCYYIFRTWSHTEAFGAAMTALQVQPCSELCVLGLFTHWPSQLINVPSISILNGLAFNLNICRQNGTLSICDYEDFFFSFMPGETRTNHNKPCMPRESSCMGLPNRGNLLCQESDGSS